MNISQEALTLMRQMMDETMAANLKLAGLASLLTSGVPTSHAGEELVISSTEAEGLARQVIADCLAQASKLAAVAAALTGTRINPNGGDDPSRTDQYVDGGSNVIKPPVGGGVHGW